MKSQPDTITVQGRVLGVRDLGGIIFVDVLSETHEVRLVCKKDYIDTEAFNQVKKIKKDDYGCFMLEEENEPRIIRLCNHIPKIQDSFWSEEQIGILRAYSYLLNLLRGYSFQNGYMEVRLPSIHYGQNNNEIFSLDFFNKPSRLTSSNALYLNAYAVQLSKVFSLQKCYRAEPSHTNRHLAEFDLFEAAMINYDLKSSIVEIEQLIKFVVHNFSKSDFAHIMRIDSDLILSSSFPVIEYEHLDNIYNLDKRGLGKYDREIANHLPTFVIYFPNGIASWMAKPLDNNYSLSFNLLVPQIGEIAEGNEKQTNLKLLSAKLKIAKMETQLGWYTRMMPYSDFPLAGFGIGVERLLMWILGLKNIRRINPIYRDTGFSEIPTDITKE
ncbi:MAG: amino acid--tRNA ligase-related protein [Syntrophomonas sp.]